MALSLSLSLSTLYGKFKQNHDKFSRVMLTHGCVILYQRLRIGPPPSPPPPSPGGGGGACCSLT
jgi:hypothetical protein